MMGSGLYNRLSTLVDMVAADTVLAGVDTVFDTLPAVRVEERILTHLKNGSACRFPHEDGRLRIYDEAGEFYGVAGVKDNMLQVEKLFIER